MWGDEMAYQSKFYGQEIDDAVQAVRDNKTIWTGKQEKLTGTQGQVVGFDSAGNAVPQGTQDLVGPQGPKGDTGPQGPPGVDGATGPAGAPGEDGFSPTVDVTEITGGHRVTITDADGPQSFDVMDGQDGGGGGGIAGVSSFKGRTGAVTPQAGDYTAAQVSVTPPTGMTATNVQGAVSELFQSVSEGKALIASAVTDKGVETAADETFQTMHDNILEIETGGSFVGSLVVTAKPGSIVTAVKENETVSGTVDDSGSITLTLPSAGEWSVTAQLGDKITGPKTVSVGTESISMVSRLPEGYTEVEYISNPNLGYAKRVPNIDVVLPKNRIEFDLKLIDTEIKNGRYLWGKEYINYSRKEHDIEALKINTANHTIDCYCSYSNSSFSYSSVGIEYPDDEKRMKIIIDSPKRIFEINGVQKQISKMVDHPYSSYPPEIFAGYYYIVFQSGTQDGGVGYDPLNYKLYSLKVFPSTETETGDALYEYVPCIGPDGEAGLYDLVHGMFTKSSVSAKPFVAGPAV